jgi:hypothetical protein
MSQDAESVAGEAQATSKTILLVEDDPYSSAFLVEAIAQETSYRAIVSGDSNAALKVVRHFAPIPAILITADRSVSQQQLQQRQLITFLKPFELEAFLATIETLLTSS